MDSPVRTLFNEDLIKRYDRSGPRYTSFPSADRFVNEFPEGAAREALSGRDSERDLSLYFHVPFCETLCFYCGCHKIPTRKHALGPVYVDNLIREMALVIQELQGPRRVRQIHFGGGTPTFLAQADIDRLMTYVRSHFECASDMQCGIEVDPRRLDRERIGALRKLGFNRISLGIQDFDHEVQKAVNRLQSREETFAIMDAARAHGFTSINVDLIYGLPKQNLESFERTLDEVIAQRPDRVAIYNYAHLPERFSAQQRIKETELPSPETKLKLLESSIQKLIDAGYEYIGMDHFALPEDELTQALHNGTLQRNFQGYSTHGDCDMLGFGISSIGQIGGTYLQNVKALDVWERALDEGRLPVTRGYTLDDEDILRSAIIHDILCKGDLKYSDIESQFGIDFWQHFGLTVRRSLDDFEADGLIENHSSGFSVLPPGRLLIRHIAMIFDHHLHRETSAKYSKVI